MTRTVAVVGGGPAGLMAAEVIAAAVAGAEVIVFDRMPSVGRKLQLAGRGGLNLTHTEPLDAFLDRYGAARPALSRAIAAFGPDELRAWSTGLGQRAVVGTSGRVFPQSFRTTPLLRAWIHRLRSLGVEFRLRHHWTGWDGDGALRFDTPDGPVRHRADATVLALGGASWPRTGSDGGWTAALAGAGVAVTPLRPANVGFIVAWSPHFRDRFGGTPLKNVRLSFGDRSVRGEVMITAVGVEGGAVYALGPSLREAVDAAGAAEIRIDLRPDLDHAELAVRLVRRRRGGDSASSTLRRAAGLTPAATALLRETGDLPDLADAEGIARRIKSVRVTTTGPQPIERAISTAGGVSLADVDGRFMLHRRPGTFVAGEMLDWEAPTGGYLLQASFSTGVAAARGVLGWWQEGAQSIEEVRDGDTLWRFDREFLQSRWTCIWGRGCVGILPEPAPELGQGCCSIGADLDGDDEARTISALAAMIDPGRFQHHAEATEDGGGVFSDGTRSATRVVDGACIFLNRPGFAGGAGCALHLEALAVGESPREWKPSVCWQLPVKVDWEPAHGGGEVATVRRWTRADWGREGETMAWCCTEGERAYVGERPVYESLADELTAVVGTEVYVELRRRLAGPPADPSR